jgi:hypothetical protein
VPGIEAMAPIRGGGAVNAISVTESGSGAGEVTVPDLVGTLLQMQRAHLAALEEAQLDGFGMRRKEREVDPAPVPMGAERPRPPGLQAHAVDHGTHSR